MIFRDFMCAIVRSTTHLILFKDLLARLWVSVSLPLGGLLIGSGDSGSDIALIRDAVGGADFFRDVGGGDGLGVVSGPWQGGRRPTADARPGPP